MGRLSNTYIPFSWCTEKITSLEGLGRRGLAEWNNLDKYKIWEYWSLWKFKVPEDNKYTNRHGTHSMPVGIHGVAVVANSSSDNWDANDVVGYSIEDPQ